MKWTRDQSQLESFCILQLSGDPFKSAKSRPASALSPIETRSKYLLENVCMYLLTSTFFVNLLVNVTFEAIITFFLSHRNAMSGYKIM